MYKTAEKMEFFHPISLSEALQKIGDKDKFGMKYSKGSGSLRSFFGLRFSENLEFLILCGLHSHNKGNTPLLPRATLKHLFAWSLLPWRR